MVHNSRMARPRSFDETEIRTAVLLQFWGHGFDGTALPDLEAATGLSRKSLYNAFGDKHQMFVTALGDFRAMAVASNTAVLKQAGASLPSVQSVFDGLLAQAATPQGGLGCMICNTSREDVSQDPAVRKHIDAYFATLQGDLLKAIKTAQANGEIADRSADDMANACVGAIVSISVLAKAGQPVSILQSIASETLHSLR